MIVNGHGGNLEALRRAIATATAEGRVAHAWSPSIPGGDAHAGRTETSLLLAIDPSCVRVDALEPGSTDAIGDVLDRLRVDGVRAIAPNGVLGDPTHATTAEGEELLATLVADLRTRLDEWFPT